MALTRKSSTAARSTNSGPVQVVPETPVTPRAPDEIPEEMVAARAYELWQRRGAPVGESDQDWYAARQELEQERLNWAAPTNADRSR